MYNARCNGGALYGNGMFLKKKYNRINLNKNVESVIKKFFILNPEFSRVYVDLNDIEIDTGNCPSSCSSYNYESPAWKLLQKLDFAIQDKINIYNMRIKNVDKDWSMTVYSDDK